MIESLEEIRIQKLGFLSSVGPVGHSRLAYNSTAYSEILVETTKN